MRRDQLIEVLRTNFAPGKYDIENVADAIMAIDNDIEFQIAKYIAKYRNAESMTDHRMARYIIELIKNNTKDNSSCNCKSCGNPMKNQNHCDPEFLCMNPHCDQYIKIQK